MTSLIVHPMTLIWIDFIMIESGPSVILYDWFELLHRCQVSQMSCGGFDCRRRRRRRRCVFGLIPPSPPLPHRLIGSLESEGEARLRLISHSPVDLSRNPMAPASRGEFSISCSFGRKFIFSFDLSQKWNRESRGHLGSAWPKPAYPAKTAIFTLNAPVGYKLVTRSRFLVIFRIMLL